MKRFSFIVILLGLCIGLALYATAASEYPTLQDGDLIFQTSTSNQSSAILFATAHPFTHMGIIKRKGSKIVVIEAAGRVQETRLDAWVKRGIFGRVAIYRDTHLTMQQKLHIINTAETYYGRPYDIFFSFENASIYCSELPYLAYKATGISIGKVQKISELNVDNILVKKADQTTLATA